MAYGVIINGFRRMANELEKSMMLDGIKEEIANEKESNESEEVEGESEEATEDV